jgi:hypothetical protein
MRNPCIACVIFAIGTSRYEAKEITGCSKQVATDARLEGMARLKAEAPSIFSVSTG